MSAWTILKAGRLALSSVSSVIVALCLAPGSRAQTSPETTGVSAERWIPLPPPAVTDFSGPERAEFQIGNAQSIAAFAPGLEIQSVPDRMTIRGVGRYSDALGSDQGVGVWLDGIYHAEAAALDTSALFVMNTEVRRGPQGTLLGKNAIGGAVLMTSYRPTDDYSGAAFLGYDSRKNTVAVGKISGPIRNGLKFLASGMYTYSNGDFRNLSAHGSDLDKAKNLEVQAQLQWDISQDASWWFAIGTLSKHRVPIPNVLITPYLTDVLFLDGDLVPQANFGNPAINPSVTDPYTVRIETPGPHSVTKDVFVTSHFDWTIQRLALKFITGWYKHDRSGRSDYDGSDRESYSYCGFLDTHNPMAMPQCGTIGSQYWTDTWQNEEFWSGELTATYDGPAVRWVTGVYYDVNHADKTYSTSDPLQAQLSVPSAYYGGPPKEVGDPRASPNAFYFTHNRYTSVSYAVFGQVDYRLSPEWSLQAGVRRSWYSKHGSEYFQSIYWNPNILGLTAALNVTPDESLRFLQGTWAGWSGNATLSWAPDDTQILYASVSRGYKSGGFELGSFDRAAITRPEKLWAYELGYKAALWSSLQIEGNVYYYDHRDLQISGYGYEQSVGATAPAILPPFTNIPAAQSYGAEVESVWQATEDLKLRLAYSYMNSRFSTAMCVEDSSYPLASEAGCGLGTVNIRGNALPVSPERSFTLNGKYVFHLRSSFLTAVGAYNWNGPRYYSLFNSPVHRAPANRQLNASLKWQRDDASYFVRVYANNLTNNRIYSAYTAGAAPVAGGRVVGQIPITVTVRPHATFGVQFAYWF